mmetsp:Transcript_37622/g.79319  ORF Transcript_37622/g.79319 Transcript_37622/m.79319 type:complete len:383 (-) Transcript_37622:1347-2495(-)
MPVRCCTPARCCCSLRSSATVHFNKRSSQRIVVIHIQRLHSLSQLRDILLTLMRHKVGYVTQLMFRHGVPPGDAFVTSHGAGIALSARSDVVLKDEVLADHARAIPYELVNIEGWRRIVRLLALCPSFVGSLPVSLHDPLLQISANPLQHLRRPHPFRHVQLKIGRAPPKSLHGRIPQRPLPRMQAARIGDFQQLYVPLAFPPEEFLVGTHGSADPDEGFGVAEGSYVEVVDVVGGGGVVVVVVSAGNGGGPSAGQGRRIAAASLAVVVVALSFQISGKQLVQRQIPIGRTAESQRILRGQFGVGSGVVVLSPVRWLLLLLWFPLLLWTARERRFRRGGRLLLLSLLQLHQFLALFLDASPKGGELLVSLGLIRRRRSFRGR